MSGGFVDQRLALLLAVSERVVKDKKCIVFLPTKELTTVSCLVQVVWIEDCRVAWRNGSGARLHALAAFKSNNAQYLMATDVAAKGLDIPSVDCVLNYSMPANYNQYLHRVGKDSQGRARGFECHSGGRGGSERYLKAVLKNSTAPFKQRSLHPQSSLHTARS